MNCDAKPKPPRIPRCGEAEQNRGIASMPDRVWRGGGPCRRVIIRVLTAASFAGFASCADAAPDASGLSCSSAETKSAVIDIEKDALKAAPLFAMLDLDSTEFTLESVRTEGNNGFKLECAATLIGDPKPKDLDTSDEKTAAAVGEIFAKPFKDGITFHYSVQNTDDGKLYVEVHKR